MRVAIFSDSFTPQINGVVTQIKNLSQDLTRRGHEVMIVAPAAEAKFSERDENGVKAIFMPSVSLPTYEDYRITVPHSGRVFEKLKKFSPDIIHVHTPFGVGWFGVNCAKSLKVPVIGTYHTLLPEFLMYLPLPLVGQTDWAKKTTWQYTNLFYNRCSLVTTPTLSMKKELEKNGIKREVVALPNAIDFDLFNSFAGKKKSSKKVKMIYFGRVSYEKNIEVLLFMLRHLLWKNHSVELSITGSGPAVPYLKNIVAEQKLSEHVKFHGAMPSEKLAKHVAGHDIFATASTIETQGLTIIESMAAGLPCIGADYMAIPDTIKEGKNGFLFKPYDFLDAARKVQKFISSSALRKKLGENAIKTAREFSLGKITAETIELYQKTISDFKGK